MEIGMLNVWSVINCLCMGETQMKCFQLILDNFDINLKMGDFEQEIKKINSTVSEHENDIKEVNLTVSEYGDEIKEMNKTLSEGIEENNILIKELQMKICK